ncbi:type II toxin-antitoxin system HigB family toxin [Oxalobacteraceae bacterium]|nr:type II toxin-antitoxin system HigB family toxin [Oxalobacteraceae bacterium]
MRILNRGVLANFCRKHPDCRKWISHWISEVESSRWESTHDIKRQFRSASLLPEKIVIFNVRGNEYRIETQISYVTGAVLIKWCGTHDQYTKRMH